jgi:Na+-transporting NADH:ubiquinone oxidoreductase subunit C
MKDSFGYPIIFMLIMVIIFGGILAVMYRVSEAKIKDYQIDTYQKAILGTLAGKIADITEQSREDILQNYPKSFDRYVQKLEVPGFERKMYQATVADKVVAYCFEIGGKGLWGTMQALISTSTDFRIILDFEIVDQQETPGLGARIEEDWFLEQFRNRLFVVNPESSEDVTQGYEFIAETQTPEHEGQLRRVTGATITSDSVIKMLRAEMNYIYNYLRTSEL